jgi:hypothetical protein
VALNWRKSLRFCHESCFAGTTVSSGFRSRVFLRNPTSSRRSGFCGLTEAIVGWLEVLVDAAQLFLIVAATLIGLIEVFAEVTQLFLMKSCVWAAGTFSFARSRELG